MVKGSLSIIIYSTALKKDRGRANVSGGKRHRKNVDKNIL
jgi:hypothetical protein